VPTEEDGLGTGDAAGGPEAADADTTGGDDDGAVLAGPGVGLGVGFGADVVRAVGSGLVVAVAVDAAATGCTDTYRPSQTIRSGA